MMIPLSAISSDLHDDSPICNLFWLDDDSPICNLFWLAVLGFVGPRGRNSGEKSRGRNPGEESREGVLLERNPRKVTQKNKFSPPPTRDSISQIWLETDGEIPWRRGWWRECECQNEKDVKQTFLLGKIVVCFTSFSVYIFFALVSVSS
jgi:hypothetical protein